MATKDQYPCSYSFTETGKAESTDDETSPEHIFHKTVKTNLCKYKTEMCKNFSENGFCPYQNKCQFAHGQHELTTNMVGIKRAYRTKKCKSFWETGLCRYGFRCQFSHYEAGKRNERQLLVLASMLLSLENSHGYSSRVSRFEKTKN